ncbi:hypothetical protein COCON_G00231050 [Conger conger]|uniref:Uncharacterized protein n=1 Tax=Conger conger TaxID=82655 RepID=A0A9Q1HN23_CONCO|nr:hypothetical protein COCON_G00231050 [Conger conger]
MYFPVCHCSHLSLGFGFNCLCSRLSLQTRVPFLIFRVAWLCSPCQHGCPRSGSSALRSSRKHTPAVHTLKQAGCRPAELWSRQRPSVCPPTTRLPAGVCYERVLKRKMDNRHSWFPRH